MLPEPVAHRSRRDLHALRGEIASWRDQAIAFDWKSLFSSAQNINRQTLERAASDDPYETVVVYRAAQGIATIKMSMVCMVMMATVLFTQHILMSVLESVGAAERDREVERLAGMIDKASSVLMTVMGFSTIALLMAGAAVVMFSGGATTTTKRRRRQPAEVNLVVPAPLTYGATAELGAEGELVAKVWRNVPHVADGDMDLVREPLGEWAFSAGEDTAEAVELWDDILSQLDEVEEAAAGPYRDMLAEHGLEGEQRVATEVALRLRVDDARERRRINAGVVDSLNRHADGRQQAV